jgi:acyl-coenzyme A thioesterase 13
MSRNSDDFDISHVAGNAPDHIKRVLCNTSAFFANQHPEKIKGPIFVEDMQNRFNVTEVSILEKAEAPEKLEGRVVLEVKVDNGIVLCSSSSLNA